MREGVSPARDVHAYLRGLEAAIIETLRFYGIDAGRREKLTGVWVGQRKIASIGVGIRRWITLHGLALNVSSDLRYFENIVPCGIEGCRMTSIAREGRPGLDVAAAAAALAGRFATVFGYGRIATMSAAEIWRRVEQAPAPGFEADCG